MQPTPNSLPRPINLAPMRAALASTLASLDSVQVRAAAFLAATVTR